MQLAKRGRARPAARPRPHHPARALRRGRRGRPAALAGLPAAVGLRPAASASRRSARPREAVDLLGHHPSIAIWCGHNEPMALDIRRLGRALDGAAVAWPLASLAQELPTWNKTVLDRSVKRALEKADGTRPGDRPLRRAPPPSAARRHRQPPLLRLVPRRRARLPGVRSVRCRAWSRFVSEFGAQAVPDDRRLLRARALARPRLGAPGPHATRCRRTMFDRHVPPADHATFDDVADARRRRTRPPSSATTSRRCAGSSTGRPAASPSSASPTAIPAVTWSVLGHDRAAEGRLPRRCATACRPVIVVADRLPEQLSRRRRARPRRARGERPAGADRGAEVTARLSWTGRHTRGAGGATSPPTAASGSAPSSSSCPTPPVPWQVDLDRRRRRPAEHEPVRVQHRAPMTMPAGCGRVADRGGR